MYTFTWVIHHCLEQLSAEFNDHLPFLVIVEGQVDAAQQKRWLQLEKFLKGMTKLCHHEEVSKGLGREADPAHLREGEERGCFTDFQVFCWSFELFGFFYV